MSDERQGQQGSCPWRTDLSRVQALRAVDDLVQRALVRPVLADDDALHARRCMCNSGCVLVHSALRCYRPPYGSLTSDRLRALP